ncbi:hypothetical protein [Devosia sp.]
MAQEEAEQGQRIRGSSIIAQNDSSGALKKDRLAKTLRIWKAAIASSA